MENIKITQELVRELFDYKEGKLFWKAHRHCCTVGKEAGTLQIYNGGDRMRVGIYGNKYISSRIIFLLHRGYMPKIVDHKDGNTLNDRIENLRDANYCKNNRNRRPQKTSSSKYLGVDRNQNKTINVWRAQLGGNGVKLFLGNFQTEEQAALVYNEAALKLYGEFANLNIINS